MKQFFFLMCVLLSWGCKEDNPGYISDPQLPGECRAGSEVEEVFENFEVSNAIDILFVIDNSGDAGEMQAVLSDAIPSFLTEFEEAGKNVAFGVATTDPSAQGLAKPGQTAEGCAGNGTVVVESEEDEKWKEVAACNVVLEVTEDQPDVIFSTIQKLVLQGDSLKFWRERARKLIVVVSRDDDCSATGDLGQGPPREACASAENLTEIANFVEFIESQSQTDEGITVAFVAGPASDGETEPGRIRPVCNSRIGPVYAGNRFEEAAVGLGHRANFQNVCSEDLSPALQSIARDVLQKPISLCAGRPMAHEPLRVLGYVDGEESELRIGDGGFVYRGSQPECENGILEFDKDDLEEIEIKYCAL